MAQPIYLQIGDKDRVSLEAFISALRNFLGILEDLDSTISGERNGSVRWEVMFLQKESPPVVGVIAQPRNEFVNFAASIEKEVIDGLTVLSYAPERHEYYSDAALVKVKRLASQSKALGRIKVYTKEAQPRQTLVDESTLKNVNELTGTKEQSYGSVTGSLDAITVHRANEFRVWDENTNRAVTCRFPSNMEDDIKRLLRNRVLVHGLVYSNEAGTPTAIDVEGVEACTPESQLPSIEEMSGLVDDFTDGLPLGEYLERLRDE